MRILLFLLIFTAFVWSNIGNVGAYKGTATIIRSSGTLDIENGMALNVKDKIITSEKSQVQVILKDNTVVTIGPKSTFVFDAFTFGGKDDSEVKMHIDRGFFRSVTGKIGKLAPERFKVKTVSATIGIRGTDFSARVSENKETISCYHGSINIIFNNATYVVNAHGTMKLSDGVAELKALSGKRKVRSINEEANNKKIKSDEIADATQQERVEAVRPGLPGQPVVPPVNPPVVPPVVPPVNPPVVPPVNPPVVPPVNPPVVPPVGPPVVPPELPLEEPTVEFPDR